MKKLLVTILSLCILLIGCTHTESNNIETDFLSDDLILQEQISPNKEYVTEEKDIVYYTVEVYQNDNNTITVNTSSNSGFFKPNQLPRCKHSSTVLGSYVTAHSTCLSLLLPQD